MIPVDVHPDTRSFVIGTINRMRDAGVPSTDALGGPSIQDFSDQVRKWMLAEEDADPDTLDKYIQKMSVVEMRLRKFFPSDQAAKNKRQLNLTTGQRATSGPQESEEQPQTRGKRSASEISANDAANANVARTFLDSSTSTAANQALAALIETSSLEVKCLAPLVSRNTITAIDFQKICSRAADMLRSIRTSDSLDECGDLGSEMDGGAAAPENFRGRADELARTMQELLHGASETHDAAGKLHQAFWLATFTQGADWITYAQIKFRANYDLIASALDPSVVPITDWAEQIRTAKACLHNWQVAAGPSASGVDFGPICPDVVAHYRCQRPNRGGRGGGYAGAGGGPGGSGCASSPSGAGSGCGTSGGGGGPQWESPRPYSAGPTSAYAARDAGGRPPAPSRRGLGRHPIRRGGSTPGPRASGPPGAAQFSSPAATAAP